MSRFRPNIFKNIIWIFLILILLFGINYYLQVLNKEDSLLQTDKVEIGGNFTLVDQENKIFSSSKLNKFKLIYFGYTYCPDVCPFDMLKITNLFLKNKNLINYVQPIFITVDPDRDNTTVIKNFLDNFETKFIGLTGTNSEIKKVLKKFKIYQKKNFGDSKNSNDNYLIDHSVLFYLMDENDKYLSHFSTKNFEEDFLKFLNNLKIIS